VPATIASRIRTRASSGSVTGGSILSDSTAIARCHRLILRSHDDNLGLRRRALGIPSYSIHRESAMPIDLRKTFLNVETMYVEGGRCGSASRPIA
jgi:hypothetical protein